MYNHVAIPVLDLTESEEFYEKLGLKRIKEWNKPEEDLSSVVMEKEGFILELVFHPTNKFIVDSPVRETRHLGFSVPELPLLLAELREEGIKVIQEPKAGKSVKEFAFIEDPNGYGIELVVE